MTKEESATRDGKTEEAVTAQSMCKPFIVGVFGLMHGDDAWTLGPIMIRSLYT